MFVRAAVLSWLAYFGYYLCRKNFSVLMPYLKSEAGMSSGELANALFAYSLLYSIGQFVMGRLADRVGARWVAGCGMIASAIFSSLMAWPPWIGLAGALVVIQGLNGAAQSTGWPSALKLTRDWFPLENRGVLLGWWSTHLVVGGLAGTWLAAHSAEVHWTRGAWVPGVALTVIAVIFILGVRDKRRSPSVLASAGKLRITPPLLAIAAMYFCVKLTRYAFLFWLPLYMTEYLKYDKPLAGYTSAVYELIGVLGAISAGYVSQRLGGARFSVGAVMMFGLAVLCITYPMVSSLGFLANVAWIGLIGAFTFGPDTLMASTAVQDAVPAESIGAAAGFVNGVGSAGQVISPYAVAFLTVWSGWQSLFTLLSLVVLCGGLALTTQWLWTPKREGAEALS